MAPAKISFRTGGVITCLVGVALMPWKLLADYNTFILGWLGGLRAFLGPVAGIMICDYFRFESAFYKWTTCIFARNLRVFQGTQLARGGCTCARSWDRAGGSRSYRSYAFCMTTSWFVGFAVSFVAYYAMMKFHQRLALSPMTTS